MKPLLAVFAVLLFLCGCATPSYELRMKAQGGLNDQTSVDPELANQKYNKVMIIPPSGTSRGQFDNEIAYFEREFIKHGITVISGAITGRVVMEGEDKVSEKKIATGEQLSDIERALIMAKKTGVDVLLQIGSWGWSAIIPSRYFVLNPKKPDYDRTPAEYKEVSYDDYQAWQGPKRMFASPVLTFVGKLVDVSSGKIMASFKITGAANWDLPTDYTAKISSYNTIESQNYAYNGPWVNSARDRITERVIVSIARRIGGK